MRADLGADSCAIATQTSTFVTNHPIRAILVKADITLPVVALRCADDDALGRIHDEQQSCIVCVLCLRLENLAPHV